MGPSDEPRTAGKSPPTLQEDLLKKMEAQGKEWDAQLALWGAKADKASEAVKADFHKWQREFKDQRGTAQKKLDALRVANRDAWDDVKSGADSAWEEAKAAFESAKKRFNM